MLSLLLDGQIEHLSLSVEEKRCIKGNYIKLERDSRCERERQETRLQSVKHLSSM